MRVLAFDPGAKRMGYAILENGPVYIDSGIETCMRFPNEPYQEYRARLIDQWVGRAFTMCKQYHPDLVAYETLPVRGFRDMSQALLAATAITTVHAVAIYQHLQVSTYAANSVKARIAGSNKATKVGVRKGVQLFLPELDVPGWPQYPDESDAVAIGLTALGYKL